MDKASELSYDLNPATLLANITKSGGLAARKAALKSYVLHNFEGKEAAGYYNLKKRSKRGENREDYSGVEAHSRSS